MTVAADLANRINEDAELANSQFLTVVGEYGMGCVELMNDIGYRPGAALKLEVEVDRDAAEQYDENDQLPDPLESDYGRPEWAYKDFRAVVRESGRERRERGLGDAGLSIPDPDRKLQVAARAIAYQIAVYFDGTSDGQIQGLIDSSTAFGGLSRTTYSKLASYEVSASNASVSIALISKLLTMMRDDPYFGMPEVVLASATQLNVMKGSVAGGKLELDFTRGPATLTPSGIDAEPGVPVMMLPNLTNTVLLALSGVSDGSWIMAWNEPNPGRYHVLDLGAGESDTPLRLQLSTALAIGCKQPQRQGKMTTLSTS